MLLIVIGLARREQTGRELAHLKTLLRPRPLLECLAVILAIAAFGWVATFDLDRWYYSSIGDEHPFFELAREFALGGGAVRNLFS